MLDCDTTAAAPTTINPVAELLLLLPLLTIRDDSINHDNPSIPAIMKLMIGPTIAIFNSFRKSFEESSCGVSSISDTPPKTNNII